MYSRARVLRNQRIDAVLELEADIHDAQVLDRGGDSHIKRAIRYTLAGCDWISAHVPGATRLLTLFGGILDELRAYVAVDALRDRKLDEVLADAKLLAGLIDPVEDAAPARQAVTA